jgi:hypothetical protein
MLIYLPNDPLPGGKYNFSYSSLREDYLRYTMMSDDQFVATVEHVLHFACIVCYVKEISGDRCLSDEGIVHELVHVLLERDKPTADGSSALGRLEVIRSLFNRDCCLA